MIAPRQLLGLPAPAKVNLFLHVLGRRADGYHEIESVFAPIGLWDTLDFALREDGRIEREGDRTGPPDADLAVRAARALQQHAQSVGRAGAERLGATIAVQKRVPVGAGLGGGSSDAATTLIAVNCLWRLGLSRHALIEIGARLGADVPFFLGEGAAFVEGIGERVSAVHLPAAWYLVVFPQVAVSTAEIFADPKLTRDTKRTTISSFSAALSRTDSALFGTNDLEPVVRSRCAPVDQALRLLGRLAPARMSGSGSAVFCRLRSAEQAQRLLERVRRQMPPDWSAWAVPGLEELPLADWLRGGQSRGAWEAGVPK
ncbi:MAG TPA: 4-(cytidine 5'-diphospho)-2-C-methyl-D-erythritol kinase [Burkholderiaceae bacterium]|nr:4-(cytidine 5'-diphospho)-2-C-methyl-D-erythritol kinase [Burkholderiaceae bacterium]